MDDATISDFIATVSEQALILERNLATCEPLSSFCKRSQHSRCRRRIQLEAAKQLRNLENMLFESDPKSQERKEVAGIIEALKLLKKRGGGRQNDS